ncbi:hypothetical protein [Streptomyces sp. NBC_01320]|uniref:hypothetical protein n=1 Tax=Streptomyces sp. NBC_01320 TaxID=2903824 RepID=UPI002E1180B2|nr:hypothetical protein OG395_35505 [Streptomyces sp. NBC_01320]
MSQDRGTFGGTWTRPTRSGIGHSQRELQDRASFDQAPAAGVSCLIVLALPVMGLAILAALLNSAGVIA